MSKLAIVATFYDAHGVEVETVEGTPEKVAEKAASFMILHGSDPDENGAAAAPGRIDFRPAGVPAAEPATSAVIKCTQSSPNNVAFIRHTKGRGWACTLANGIPAAMSYGGIPHGQETETVVALERAKTPADVLRIIQNRQYRNWSAELV